MTRTPAIGQTTVRHDSQLPQPKPKAKEQRQRLAFDESSFEKVSEANPALAPELAPASSGQRRDVTAGLPELLAKKAQTKADAIPTVLIGEDGCVALSSGVPAHDFVASPELRQQYLADAENGREQYERFKDEEPVYNKWACIQRVTERRAQFPELAKLPMAEAACLQWYSDFGYQIVSEDLWASRPPSDPELFLLTLSGLNQLPAYEGRAYRVDFYTANPTPERVQERVENYRRLLAAHQPFIAKGAWSASQDESFLAKHVASNSPDVTVLVEIDAKSAHSIECVSSCPDEKEVVFIPGTRFDVLGIREEKIGNTKAFIVSMREIPSP